MEVEKKWMWGRSGIEKEVEVLSLLGGGVGSGKCGGREEVKMGNKWRCFKFAERRENGKWKKRKWNKSGGFKLSDWRDKEWKCASWEKVAINY